MEGFKQYVQSLYFQAVNLESLARVDMEQLKNYKSAVFALYRVLRPQLRKNEDFADFEENLTNMQKFNALSFNDVVEMFNKLQDFLFDNNYFEVVE